MLAASIVLAVLTLALAVSTSLYTFVAARSLNVSVRPRFAVDLFFLGPMYAEILVRNVGNGVAIEPRFTLEIRPVRGSEQVPIVKRWEAGLLAPGTALRFSPSDGPDGALLYVAQLAEMYEGIYLTGSAKDLLGRTVALSAQRTGLVGWWEGVKESGLTFDQDQVEGSAKQLKAMATSLQDLSRDFQTWRRQSRGE